MRSYYKYNAEHTARENCACTKRFRPATSIRANFSIACSITQECMYSVCGCGCSVLFVYVHAPVAAVAQLDNVSLIESDVTECTRAFPLVPCAEKCVGGG